MKNTIKGINTANEFIRLIKNGKSEVSIDDYPEIKELVSKNKHFDALKQNLTNKETYSPSHDQKQEDVDRLLNTIINKERAIKQRNRLIRLSISIASAVAVVSFLFFYDIPKKDLPVKKYIVLETLPKSTYNTPTLLLSNGANVDISKEQNEILADGAKIIKRGNNIVYSASTIEEKTKAVEIEKTAYNTLIIPKMCTFSIVLDDGTEVILNANSELKYPTKFSGNTRDVHLKGEAYFKVKKGTNPFVVNCSDVKIKVYGTEFNVRANNPTEVSTVLVKGSIGGLFTKNNGKQEEVILEPNEMMTINFISEKIDIKEVDPQSYIAWIDGYFRHDSDNLKALLEELSMWYNTDFYIENEQCCNTIITCSFNKESKLDYIINSLQEITTIKFEKKGDDYIVR